MGRHDKLCYVMVYTHGGEFGGESGSVVYLGTNPELGADMYYNLQLLALHND